MEKIVLLIRDTSERLLLQSLLCPCYTVVTGTPGKALSADFDLCIIDQYNLQRHAHAVSERRAREQPAFLPVLAVTSKEDLGQLTDYLEDTVDDLLFRPIQGAVLRIRTTLLLRIRRLSMDIRMRNQPQAQRDTTRLKFAVKAGSIGLWDWNVKNGNVYFSPEWKGQIGYEDAELPNDFKEWERRIHPDDRARVTERLRAFVKHPSPGFEIEYRFQHKDGSYRWILSRSSLMVDEQGTPERLLGAHTDVTDQKRTEQELRDSVWFRERIAELLPWVLYVHDLTTRTNAYANREIGRVLGYSPRQIQEMGPDFIPTFMHPGDIPRFEKHLRLLGEASEGRVLELEYRMRSSHGEWRWFRSHDTVLDRDENGAPLRILGVASDVTESRQAQETLRNSEDRLRKTMLAANDGMWDWNLETNEVYYDQRYYEMAGYEADEFPHRLEEFHKRVHPDDINAVMDHARRHLCGETERFEVEFRFRIKSGDWMWILGRGTIVERNADGKPVRFVGTHTDITARKLAEQEREKALALLEVSLAQSPSGIIIADAPDVTIRYANPAALAMRGTTETPLSGIDLTALTPNWQVYLPDGKPYPSEELPLSRAVLRGETTRNEEVIMRNSHGSEHWVLVNAAPIRNSEGTIVSGIVVFHDITKRKEYQADLRSSLRQRNTLLQELYHRTKNNMQVISSFLELQAATTDNADLERILHDSGTRIRTMALAHEKLYQAKDLSQINMRDYITELTKLLAASYSISPRNVNIRFDVEELQSLIDVAIPCGLVLNELLSNSFKYAFPHGRKGRIDIGLHRRGDDLLELTVADNGVGLPPGFDIMRSSTLGVQLVRQIVKHQLHGTAEAHTEGGIRWHIRFHENLYSERV